MFLALTLVAAACGADDAVSDVASDAADAAGDVADEVEEAVTGDDEEEAMEDEDDAAAGGGEGGELVIGTILPVTGDLAFLGPAEIGGSNLAVEDINAAGGVFGTDVVILQGDSGDTTTDTASVEVDRLLAEGADAIIGAASSAVSLTVIDRITQAGVIQFSPANTSPDFTTYDDGGLYFRTCLLYTSPSPRDS